MPVERKGEASVERSAGRLKPLAINHTAKTTCWRAAGALRTLFTVVKPKSWAYPLRVRQWLTT